MMKESSYESRSREYWRVPQHNLDCSKFSSLMSLQKDTGTTPYQSGRDICIGSEMSGRYGQLTEQIERTGGMYQSRISLVRPGETAVSSHRQLVKNDNVRALRKVEADGVRSYRVLSQAQKSNIRDH
jgi:hypothetical protein